MMDTIGRQLDLVRLAAHGAFKFAQVFLRRRRPFILNHLITVRCNLKCPFCYVSGPEQDAFNRERYPRRAEMTTGELREFYGQLVALDFKLVVIVGGEPLLRDDLDRVTDVLVGRTYVTIFTNGFLLKDRVELLSNANNVFVSLDLPDEGHDALRAAPGCFERAVAGIETLRRRYPKKAVVLMTTVTDGNVRRIREMIAFAREMRLPIAFQPPSYRGQFDLQGRPQAESAQQAAARELVADAFRAIKEAADRDRVVGSNAFFDLVIQDRGRYPCHYPAYVLGPVYPNGDVLGCTASRMIANVRETPVADILEGSAFRANAAAGPTCPFGCRDWGIHDLSAVHNHEFMLPDVRRLFRGFIAGN